MLNELLMSRELSYRNGNPARIPRNFCLDSVSMICNHPNGLKSPVHLYQLEKLLLAHLIAMSTIFAVLCTRPQPSTGRTQRKRKTDHTSQYHRLTIVSSFHFLFPNMDAGRARRYEQSNVLLHDSSKMPDGTQARNKPL